MDVECPSPVCKDPLLCDEAMVAAATASLVGDVHGTFVRALGLVVVIRDRVVLRLPGHSERGD